MNKGVVMEIAARHLVVLTADGQFLKLRRRSEHYDIGDEISLSEPSVKRWQKSASQWAAASIAAMLIGVLALWSGVSLWGNNPSIAAYVNVDINPSMEFAVDGEQKVIEARGLNLEGIRIVKDLDFENKPLVHVIVQLMTLVDKEQYLSPYLQQGTGSIMITSTVVGDERAPQMDTNEMTLAVEKTVHEYMESHHPESADTLNVAKAQATQELRETARQQGVSAGKATLKQIAEEQGKPIEWKTLQETNISDIVQELGGPEAVGKLLDQKRKAMQPDEASDQPQQPDSSQTKKKSEDQRGNSGNKSDRTGNSGKQDDKDASKEDKKEREDERNLGERLSERIKERIEGLRESISNGIRLPFGVEKNQDNERRNEEEQENEQVNNEKPTAWGQRDKEDKGKAKGKEAVNERDENEKKENKEKVKEIEKSDKDEREHKEKGGDNARELEGKGNGNNGKRGDNERDDVDRKDEDSEDEEEQKNKEKRDRRGPWLDRDRNDDRDKDDQDENDDQDEKDEQDKIDENDENDVFRGVNVRDEDEEPGTKNKENRGADRNDREEQRDRGARGHESERKLEENDSVELRGGEIGKRLREQIIERMQQMSNGFDSRIHLLFNDAEFDRYDRSWVLN